MRQRRRRRGPDPSPGVTSQSRNRRAQVRGREGVLCGSDRSRVRGILAAWLRSTSRRSFPSSQRECRAQKKSVQRLYRTDQLCINIARHTILKSIGMKRQGADEEQINAVPCVPGIFGEYAISCSAVSAGKGQGLRKSPIAPIVDRTGVIGKRRAVQQRIQKAAIVRMPAAGRFVGLLDDRIKLPRRQNRAGRSPEF